MAGEKVESEVAKQLDLNVIRYSRVVEDHRVLSRGLEIEEDRDVVLCITSSGDNVLNLLLDRPKKMLAIDMSPAQNSILEIKLAAIRQLQYRDYLCLLGQREEERPNSRIDLYQKIRTALPRYAQDFWDGHQEVLTAGMSEQGRLQKYIKKVQTALHESVSADQLDRFMSAKDLSEQNTLFQQLPLDKVKEVHLHFFNRSTVVAGRSEAQYKYVMESEDKISLKLWDRFYALCTKVPLQDNFYLSWWLRGGRGFDPDGNPIMAPPFLTEEGFTKLKGLVDRVEVVTSSIEDYLNNPHPPINKVGLSDVFEYMSEEASEATFALLAQSVSPGGRMAFWNLFIRRLPSKSLIQSGGVTCLEELSHQLHLIDRVFFYQDFYVVQVNH